MGSSCCIVVSFYHNRLSRRLSDTCVDSLPTHAFVGVLGSASCGRGCWLVIQSVSARSGYEWDRESVTSALALWFVTVNMTKKLVKFLILFDNTNLLYFPGQFLTGRVLVELKDDTPALGESRSSTIIPPPLDLWGGIFNLFCLVIICL